MNEVFILCDVCDLCVSVSEVCVGQGSVHLCAGVSIVLAPTCQCY